MAVGISSGTVLGSSTVAGLLSAVKETPFIRHLFTCASVFYIIWKVLMLFPIILHKKKKLGAKARSQAIAHRGSRFEGLPENSLAAFKDAVNASAHVIEFDVWLSKDAQVIVHHDKSFSRMTGGKCVADVTDVEFKDFPALAVDKAQHHRSYLFSTEEVSRVPLFKEVLQIIPESVSIIIEFKQDSSVLFHEVIRLLTESGKERYKNVFWFSLLGPVNAKLHRIEPRIPTITSVPMMLKIILSYYLGLLPFITINDGVFGITVDEISLERIRNEKSLTGVPDFIKRLLAMIFAGKPSYFMVAPKLFDHLHKRGIPVWFLGVNDEKDLDFAIRSGATGVLTDRINWLSNEVDMNKKFIEVEG